MVTRGVWTVLCEGRGRGAPGQLRTCARVPRRHLGGILGAFIELAQCPPEGGAAVALVGQRAHHHVSRRYGDRLRQALPLL